MKIKKNRLILDGVRIKGTNLRVFFINKRKQKWSFWSLLKRTIIIKTQALLNKLKL